MGVKPGAVCRRESGRRETTGPWRTRLTTSHYERSVHETRLSIDRCG